MGLDMVTKGRVELDTLVGIISLLTFLFVIFTSLFWGRGGTVDLGVMGIISTLMYFRLRGKYEESFHTYPRILTLLFDATYAGALIFSRIPLLFDAYLRPLTYFILILVAAGALLLKIVLSSKISNDASLIILAQIFFISLIFRFDQYFRFPGYIGVDPWSNMNLFQQILDEGRMPYYPYNSPFFVLYYLVPINSLVSSLNLKYSSFFSVTFFETLSLIVVYLIGRSIANKRIALLGALIIGFSDLHILWALTIHYESLAIGIVSLVIFLLFRKRNRRLMYVALIFFATLIVTHTLSSLILFIILILFSVGERVYGRLDKFSFRKFKVVKEILPIMFGVSTLVYWMYASREFAYISEVLSFALKSAEFQPIRIYGVGLTGPLTFDELSDRIGMKILLILTYIGSLQLLSKKNLNRKHFALISTLAGLWVLIDWVGRFSDVFLPDRWIIFVYILGAIPAAYGLYFIYNIMARKKISVFILVTLFVLFSFFMITNRNINWDSPIYANQLTFRSAFTLSETYAATSIANFTNKTIVTDVSYQLPIRFLKLSQPLEDIVDWLQKTQGESEVIVVRRYIINRYMPYLIPKKYGYCTGVAKISSGDLTFLYESSFNRIFSDGNVTAFHRT